MASGGWIRRRGGAGLALMACAVALVAGGCLGTNYQYVSHTPTSTYLKLPGGWHVYDEDAVVQSKAAALTPEQQATFKRSIWQADFDANPRPSMDHVFDPAAAYPTGLVRVRKLSPADRDQISVGSLRTEFLPTDPLSTSPSSPSTLQDVVSYREVTRPGGYRGAHLVVNIHTPAGDTVTFDQLAFIDSHGGNAYVLVLACPPACYAANHTTINRILSWWTLKGHA